MLFLRALLTLRFHVAAAATLTYLAVARVTHSTPDHSYAICVFALTLSIYIANLRSDLSEDRVNKPHAEFELQQTFRPWCLPATLSGLALALWFAKTSSIPLALEWTCAAYLLGLSYSLRLLGRLKRFRALKTVVPTLVWTVTTSILPLSATHSIDREAFSVATYILIVAVKTEWLWDWRDQAGDKENGIRTFISNMSSAHSKYIFFALVSIEGIAAFILSNYAQQFSWAIRLQWITVSALLIPFYNETGLSRSTQNRGHSLSHVIVVFYCLSNAAFSLL